MNLIKIFEAANVPHRTPGTHHHTRQGWVQTDCPWCGNHSEGFHLGWSLTGPTVNCWRCGRKGLRDALEKVTGSSSAQVRKWLAGMRFDTQAIRPTGTLKLPKGLGPLLPAHVAYLQDRGLCPAMAADMWQAQGLGMDGRAPDGRSLAWRIFIPIQLYGQTISWTTRSIGSKGLRYVSAREEWEALAAKSVLYGADHALDVAIAVEGPLDVWNVGPGAVGTLGIGSTAAQATLLSRYWVRAVCFDSGVEAQARARKLVDDLSVFPGVTYNVELDAEDPGSAPAAEIKKLRTAVGLE